MRDKCNKEFNLKLHIVIASEFTVIFYIRVLHYYSIVLHQYNFCVVSDDISCCIGADMFSGGVLIYLDCVHFQIGNLIVVECSQRKTMADSILWPTICGAENPLFLVSLLSFFSFSDFIPCHELIQITGLHMCHELIKIRGVQHKGLDLCVTQIQTLL